MKQPRIAPSLRHFWRTPIATPGEATSPLLSNYYNRYYQRGISIDSSPLLAYHPQQRVAPPNRQEP